MGVNPCDGCTERTIEPNCHDNCPKDARGEYGHNAWKADMHKAKAAEKAYNQARREDFLRSEQCTHAKKVYTYSKIRMRRGKNHGR